MSFVPPSPHVLVYIVDPLAYLFGYPLGSSEHPKHTVSSVNILYATSYIPSSYIVCNVSCLMLYCLATHTLCVCSCVVIYPCVVCRATYGHTDCYPWLSVRLLYCARVILPPRPHSLLSLYLSCPLISLPMCSSLLGINFPCPQWTR